MYNMRQLKGKLLSNENLKIHQTVFSQVSQTSIMSCHNYDYQSKSLPSSKKKGQLTLGP
jgi:hypothetical protein